MYNWNNTFDSPRHHYGNLLVFSSAAIGALLLFLILHPKISQTTQDSTILINLMFIPIFIIGVIYGMKIVERVVHPSETRGRLKRIIVKIFMLFFLEHCTQVLLNPSSVDIHLRKPQTFFSLVAIASLIFTPIVNENIANALDTDNPTYIVNQDVYGIQTNHLSKIMEFANFG